jgi:transmembrane sensor
MKAIHQQYFLEILKKYNAGKASAEEKKFLESYYQLFEINEGLAADHIEENYIRTAIKKSIDKEIALQETAVKGRNVTIRFKHYAIAAAVLLSLSAGYYFLLRRTGSTEKLYAAGRQLSPGGNKALLILADGSKISLADAANGRLSRQGGITVTKTRDGQLVYEAQSVEGGADSTAFNTIETPKGGQYQVRLPDGTIVWLNAASSLRYPIAFTGHERKVQLKGEAYFEVAKNPLMPFRVLSNAQLVEVLGTHFNINSYQDEPGIKTTLLEGSVSISNLRSNRTVLLKPGQQSSSNANGTVAVADVNPEQYIAWKNGKFIFTDANIQSIMRQVSRWYNVDIEYRGDISKEKFGGSTSRFTNVAELLEILQLTDQVHFEVQGRRIIVMP